MIAKQNFVKPRENGEGRLFLCSWGWSMMWDWKYNNFKQWHQGDHQVTVTP